MPEEDDKDMSQEERDLRLFLRREFVNKEQDVKPLVDLLLGRKDPSKQLDNDQQKNNSQEAQQNYKMIMSAFAFLKRDLGMGMDLSKIQPTVVLAYARAALLDGLPNGDKPGPNILELRNKNKNQKPVKPAPQAPPPPAKPGTPQKPSPQFQAQAPEDEEQKRAQEKALHANPPAPVKKDKNKKKKTPFSTEPKRPTDT